MARITLKRWAVFSGVAFAVQVLLAFVSSDWAALMYSPFQSLCVWVFGGAWPLGLLLGIVIGAFVYCSVAGIILAWIFHKPKKV
jgi:hypothetical protein